MDWDEYRKACYFLARDAGEYIADGTFNAKAQKLIDEGVSVGGDAVSYMENVISRGMEYAEAEREFAPILVYRQGRDVSTVMSRFGDCIAAALERQGETVQLIDMSETNTAQLAKLSGKTFKACVGFQTPVFFTRFTSGAYLHDSINAPIFNIILDNPAGCRAMLADAPANYYVCTHDRDYKAFVDEYYPEVKGCFILPPGGEVYAELQNQNVLNCENQEGSREAEIRRIYEISFVGTFYNIDGIQNNVDRLDAMYGGMASRLVEYMLENKDVPYADAVRALMGDVDRNTFYDLIGTTLCAQTIFRKNVIQTILDSGLTLHVFGDSWKHPCWAGYDNLIIHPKQEGDDSIKVYAQSVCSLNIMSWHKDGRTERIANTMLNGCVSVTDKSRYLSENYTDGRDIVFFDRDHLEELPKKLRALLKSYSASIEPFNAPSNENTESPDTAQAQESVYNYDREKIAANGFAHALKDDTWDKRAEKLLNILEYVRS